MKFGLKSNGDRKSLIERIGAIWVAQNSWKKLSSLKNIFLLLFTNAKYIAQDYKIRIGKKISIFANISEYEKVDSKKLRPPPASYLVVKKI